jgi:nesprin-1
LAEKKSQLDRLKGLEERIRCERFEVDSLKSKAAEMAASGQQSGAALQAKNILTRFEGLIEGIKVCY